MDRADEYTLLTMTSRRSASRDALPSSPFVRFVSLQHFPGRTTFLGESAVAARVPFL